MHTLTKADLTATLSELHDLSRDVAQEVVESFFNIVSETLSLGEEVKLSGFGRFVLHNKEPRMARNPKTGEPALVSARRVVSFLPSVTLKARFETLAGLSEQAMLSNAVARRGSMAVAEAALAEEV